MTLISREEILGSELTTNTITKLSSISYDYTVAAEDKRLRVYRGGGSIAFTAAHGGQQTILCTSIHSSNSQTPWNCLRFWYPKMAANIVATVPKMLKRSERRASISPSDIRDTEKQSDPVSAGISLQWISYILMFTSSESWPALGKLTR